MFKIFALPKKRTSTTDNNNSIAIRGVHILRNTVIWNFLGKK